MINIGVWKVKTRTEGRFSFRIDYICRIEISNQFYPSKWSHEHRGKKIDDVLVHRGWPLIARIINRHRYSGRSALSPIITHRHRIIKEIKINREETFERRVTIAPLCPLGHSLLIFSDLLLISNITSVTITYVKLNRHRQEPTVHLFSS